MTRRSGPGVRAKRQQARDARRRAAKPLTVAAIARSVATNSLSGAVLGGQPRTARVPAYRADPAVQRPNLIQQWMRARGRTR